MVVDGVVAEYRCCAKDVVETTAGAALIGHHFASTANAKWRCHRGRPRSMFGLETK